MDASRNEEDEEEINEEGAKDKEEGVKSRGGEGPAWRGHPAVTLEIGARSDLGRHMAGQQQTHGLPTRCILISDQLMLLTSQPPPPPPPALTHTSYILRYICLKENLHIAWVP